MENSWNISMTFPWGISIRASSSVALHSDAQPVQICSDGLLRQQKEASSDTTSTATARNGSCQILEGAIGVTISLIEHVNSVISSCVRSLYAVKVLRAHGLCAAALQQVYGRGRVIRIPCLVGVCLSSSPTTSASIHFYAAVYDPDCTCHC